MHEVDLRLWIGSHPNGALAALAKRGTTYSKACTTAPSDSFPGMIAQATGGTPFSAGVFHDDTPSRVQASVPTASAGADEPAATAKK
jgi:hypothetical protein